MGACGGSAPDATGVQPGGTGGATQPVPVQPAPTEASDTEPTQVPTAEPIERSAQLAYPQRVEIAKPMPVKFSLFTEGNEPVLEPGAQTPEAKVQMPSNPGLKPFVTVKLEVGGARIVKEPVDGTQPLHETINTWEWEIEAAESQPIMLRPQIHVDYRDASGNNVESYDVAWRGRHTIEAEQVTQSAMTAAVGDWIGTNMLAVLTMFLGLPGTIFSWRALLGKGAQAQSDAAGA
jgi:hypothetical protein